MAKLLLTPERHTLIIEALQAGAYLQDAAAAAGVHRNSLLNWVTQGESDLAAGLDTPQACLVAAARETEAQCKIEILKSWKAKAVNPNGDHLAARDLLARRWPESFGPHETRTVQHHGAIAHTHVHVLTPPDLDQVFELLGAPDEDSTLDGDASEVAHLYG